MVWHQICWSVCCFFSKANLHRKNDKIDSIRDIYGKKQEVFANFKQPNYSTLEQNLIIIFNSTNTNGIGMPYRVNSLVGFQQFLVKEYSFGFFTRMI